jgi:hypothetical protein
MWTQSDFNNTEERFGLLSTLKKAVACDWGWGRLIERS